MNKVLAIFSVAGLIMLSACDDAEIANNNISKAAVNFEVTRRVTFYNSILGTAILQIEGKCALYNYAPQKEVHVVCKTGPKEFKRNVLGVSNNVTFFYEQLEPNKVDVYHYHVIIKPSVLIPDIEIR